MSSCPYALDGPLLIRFWARERSTVSSNLWLVKRHLADQEALGSEPESMPYRGPYPQADVRGMNIVCGILIRSLNCQLWEVDYC